ncbi:MAG: phosphodiesterase [Pseudomonadota bacterium]|nr:phosphodiesterase [Pseudomonadota bacterium]
MKTLVQLSDLHILPPGQLAYGRVDTAACLRRAIDAVQALPQAPTAVVVTGDLTEHGSAAEYEHLRSIIAPLGCPIYLLPGNHDDREALRQAFADHPWLAPLGPQAFVQYAVDLGGMALVAVDTVVPRASHGEICPRRLERIAELLAAASRRPSIVAMHHPPFATFIGHMDSIGLRRGAAELQALVERHGQVERVVCGHLHRSIQARWAGTIALTAPSTAHQVQLDLAVEAESVFRMEPPGFLVHAWDESGRVVTHQAVVGSYDGPYPFQ